MPAQQPTQATRDASAKPDDEKEARLLVPGKPIKRELAGDHSHIYQIRLGAGQFVKVVIEQQGIDVVAQLSGPGAEQIAEFDMESRSRGQELAPFVTEEPGVYRLTVRPKHKNAPAGDYEIRLEEFRAATENDRALQEARKMYKKAIDLRNAGKYDEALPYFEGALEIRERILGPDHSDVSQAINGLAVLHGYKGAYSKAVTLYQRALAIREKSLGPDHPDVAQSLNNLAVIYFYLGDYAKAEPLHQRALAIREKSLGPEHLDVATSLSNLAIMYIKMGDYAKAEPLQQRAMAIREKSLGPEHPDIADSLNNIASLYVYLGDYAKAEPLYQRALAVREKSLGSEHSAVAASLNNLGILYIKMGDYAKAEPLYRRALAIWEKAVGPEHPETVLCLNNLANLYLDLGDYAKAEPLHRRALAVREKTLGPEHPEVADSLNNLAIIYSTLGDYAKAEPLYRRALAIKEKSLGPEHPVVADSLSSLAKLYTYLGDYAKAEPLYRRALAIKEKALGPEHHVVAQYLNNLAGLYSILGDYAKAEPLYLRALAVLEKSLGQEHPDVADSLSGLAKLYTDLGDYSKAEPIYLRALAVREKSLGPEHPDLAYSLNNLAIIYSTLGDYAKAEPLYRRALAVREKALGPKHPLVARCIYYLAVLSRDKGEYAKAEPLFRQALAILENAAGPEHPYIAEFLNEMAVLYAAKGDFAQAVTVQSRANSVSERNLTDNLTIGSERQKLAYLTGFSRQTDFTLSLHGQALPHDPQALDLAFTTLLRRKGRGLDVMANTIGALRRHATPEDQALFDQLAEARSQLAALTLKDLETGKPETYRARLISLEDKVEELESALSARNPDFRAQAQPVMLAAVQSAIPADSALVEFAVYRPQDPRNNKNKLSPRYLAYLLTPQGQPKWTDLGESAPIDRAITSWRQALRDPRRADVKRLARAVDEKVMRPVLALAQSGFGATRRLLIASDGLLNLVPFAALVDRQGRYLVERYSISYLMSGRDLLRPPVRRPGNQDTVIVADPDYGVRGDAVASRSRDVGLPQGLPQSADSNSNLAQIYFPPLKGTEGEAQALKALLPQATVFTKDQATEATLKELHSPSVLHVATHGFFLRDQELRLVGGRDLSVDTVQSEGPSYQPIENPLLRSGLALAGVNLRMGRADQGDDGVLTALEAAGLDLWGTKLVVLSACDTGVGEVKNGEGVFGLRRALALAGSETQVMSLWSVSDLGARDLMIEYYKALERGEGRGDGLRHVQLEMLRRKGRRHPFYWASFIQSGEWANLEGKR
jgi:tetratricopeptide (TPR) repeat protein